MSEIRTVSTVCRSCHGGCGVVAHAKDGKVIKVEGDPASPISHGSMCLKGLAITQLAYHPDRVLYPIKKIGEQMEIFSCVLLRLLLENSKLNTFGDLINAR